MEDGVGQVHFLSRRYFFRGGFEKETRHRGCVAARIAFHRTAKSFNRKERIERKEKKPSLRAKRSNPENMCNEKTLDCFVASLLAMTPF
ncbi:MAG: hypothetical protein FWC38_03320 [Proteobacteria bacterium]|nr:hypothetical protein [Pseudomonadota bacterium]MCL2307258.1 hypothetical protein [Pseudomonadota bacterium]